ncbi:hypothetical protein BDB00DRAFT_180270 [Zychaea mexicana]|uniref:uncharacterized protein n=1 Tax=Zychaea mexicana TaxID=64656 RepID=UPI0022FE7C18|nr:uncharacterized protein BDB00DRAFT_180270 [Zychaea mexicana]KAI9495996.1 hypothetical protein BDB00DRAFT_180270 [Zychaea mexicana]
MGGAEVYRCHGCGAVMHRDINSSKIIFIEALMARRLVQIDDDQYFRIYTLMAMYPFDSPTKLTSTLPIIFRYSQHSSRL